MCASAAQCGTCVSVPAACRSGALRATPAAADAGAPGGLPPPLPKRGEAWSMGAREQRFASRGHVYFSESVRAPLCALHPCQRAPAGLRAEQGMTTAP